MSAVLQDSKGTRARFAHLRNTPGRRPGWMSGAAKETGYALSYISKIWNRHAVSPAAMAALTAYRAKHKIKTPAK
jgi:hypothetical protein